MPLTLPGLAVARDRHSLGHAQEIQRTNLLRPAVLILVNQNPPSRGEQRYLAKRSADIQQKDKKQIVHNRYRGYHKITSCPDDSARAQLSESQEASRTRKRKNATSLENLPGLGFGESDGHLSLGKLERKGDEGGHLLFLNNFDYPMLRGVDIPQLEFLRLRLLSIR